MQEGLMGYLSLSALFHFWFFYFFYKMAYGNIFKEAANTIGARACGLAAMTLPSRGRGLRSESGQAH